MLEFHTVNVFTDKKFSGNPLAIVSNADDLTTQQMQLIAREFNLPETIFIQKPDSQENTAKVRIFFPTDEIPFAGHPTIGCAIHLAEQKFEGLKDFETEIRLEEVAGLVPVTVSRNAGSIHAQFTAPVVPCPSGSDNPTNNECAHALGLKEEEVGLDRHENSTHSGGPTFLFVPLANRAALKNASAVEPVCTKLTKASGATGLYCYHFDPIRNEVDARMFAPAAGIPEDPATGSATALLASQLNQAGCLNDGLNSFKLRQGYDMGRQSDLSLEVDVANKQIKAVRVAGSSVFVGKGHISIPMV